MKMYGASEEGKHTRGVPVKEHNGGGGAEQARRKKRKDGEQRGSKGK